MSDEIVTALFNAIPATIVAISGFVALFINSNKEKKQKKHDDQELKDHLVKELGETIDNVKTEVSGLKEDVKTTDANLFKKITEVGSKVSNQVDDINQNINNDIERINYSIEDVRLSITDVNQKLSSILNKNNLYDEAFKILLRHNIDIYYQQFVEQNKDLTIEDMAEVDKTYEIYSKFGGNGQGKLKYQAIKQKNITKGD